MLRVGTDLVQVSRVVESLENFGERFLRRIFTDGEVAYACSEPSQTAARLAARLAAKEAVMKALDLGESGVGWRQIEVLRGPSGAPSLALHQHAAAAAAAAGAAHLAVSLSHEGDYATAVVVTSLGAPIRDFESSLRTS